MSGPGGVIKLKTSGESVHPSWLCGTNEQVQEAVSKFLPPVLLKLTSQHEGVKKKVNMKLLVQINKRIQNNHNIQLPVEALLLQY